MIRKSTLFTQANPATQRISLAAGFSPKNVKRHCERSEAIQKGLGAFACGRRTQSLSVS